MQHLLKFLMQKYDKIESKIVLRTLIMGVYNGKIKRKESKY